MSALARWASKHLAQEHHTLVLDPEKTEMALAAYAHAFDVQMHGARGIIKIFPNGAEQREARERGTE